MSVAFSLQAGFAAARRKYRTASSRWPTAANAAPSPNKARSDSGLLHFDKSVAPWGEEHMTDFAQLAKGYGAEGVFIRSADELGPALTAALASGRPTVIQAPMENIPTPTPGHWDINVVYRKGS